MATTIVIIGFSIYSFIFIGTLIWSIQYTEKLIQGDKKLKQKGILTQAKIIKLSHPQKKKKKNEAELLDDQMTSAYDDETKLIIDYEHEIKEANNTTKIISGTLNLDLDFRNTETEKNRYPLGSMIDIFYLKENPTLSNLAHKVRMIKIDKTLIYLLNIAALLSSLFVLFMTSTVGLSDNINTIEDGLSLVFGFLIYLLFLAVGLLILLAVITSAKDYFHYFQLKKKGIKETGKVLEQWWLSGSKGSITHHIKYTYPAIAPFYIKKIITSKLNNRIIENKTITVSYLEEDKFFSDIVGNKSNVFAFWVFLGVSFLTIPLFVYLSYQGIAEMFL